jgi:hypothetical protein
MSSDINSVRRIVVLLETGIVLRAWSQYLPHTHTHATVNAQTA